MGQSKDFLQDLTGLAITMVHQMARGILHRTTSGVVLLALEKICKSTLTRMETKQPN